MGESEKRRILNEAKRRLKEYYGDVPCALNYRGDGWRLLVMSRLSAQCTDKRVNEVSERLFERYPTPYDIAEADVSELSDIIRPCGFHNTKAQNIKDSMNMLLTEWGGVLPCDIDELLRLPGVGRKIANLLLGDIYGMPAMVCDTHCIRICARLGMYPEREKNPEKIERILRSLTDVDDGSEFCHRIVEFGRDICTARSPRCNVCPLCDICVSRRGES